MVTLKETLQETKKLYKKLIQFKKTKKVLKNFDTNSLKKCKMKTKKFVKFE